MNQLALAFQLREAGLDRVEHSHTEFLLIVREWAEQIAKRKGSVTADDVREMAEKYGLQPANKNAWGAVFRGKKWECVGVTTSRQIQGHGNEIKVWALR